MFVDASAIIAILTREPDAEALADVLDGASSRITSAVALFEAVLGICRKQRETIAEAEDEVRQFLELAAIEVVPITSKEAEIALGAFSRYGKGQNHPARLNLGDCFAYAVAKSYRRSLLFQGEDFSNTDIRSAMHHR